MSFKCDSCSKNFPTAVNLFGHIQQSCLAFYKSHPSSWTKILSSLGPDEETSSVSKKKRKKTNGSSLTSTPSPSSSESRDTPPPSKQTKVKRPVNTTKTVATIPKTSAPLVCKCEASFKSREEFKEHLKTCTPGKEPPFCIMFRAQDTDVNKPTKNLHMTVSDYFYGSLPGEVCKLKKISRRCNCYSCGKTLRNNIRFMSHLRHKVLNEWEKIESDKVLNICQHCYRQYDSPFLLQCHLENVHASVPAACSCRICEMHFKTEKSFLFHMKDKHVHNEAPYVCKVCMYRSSFYNDVIKHFREEHADTTALMCPFCLAVAHNSNALLKHVIQHIKKGADCQRCRLMFINAKERALHNQLDHSSNVITEKLKKYRNLIKCQVYVRVSSFQMTQRQQLLQNANELLTILPPSGSTPQAQLKRTRKADDIASGISPAKKALIAQSESQLPNYLRPLVHSSKIKRIRISNDPVISVSSHRCAECHEGLSIWNNSFVNHFQNTFECKWCVFATSCGNAANKHVLREHADAELREKLLGKSETSKKAIETVSLTDDEDDIVIKTEPNDIHNVFGQALPIPPLPEVKADEAQSSSKIEKSKETQQSKPRRKQSNPMKIADGVLKSPKRVVKEKKIQTKSFEKEKGIQTSEKEFETTVADIGTKVAETPIVRKEFRRPGIKIQNKPAKTAKSPTKSKRKVLAPEGFFPDIDDDEGWAKYFKECEDTDWKPSSAGTPHQPRPISVLNKKTSLNNLKQLTAGEEKFILPATSLSQKPISLSQLQLQPVSIAKTPVSGLTPANKKTRPVYQFQLIPKGKFQKPTVTPKPISFMLDQLQGMVNRVPRSPVDLRCLEVTHSSLLIQWELPGNCSVTQFKVVFQGSGAPTVQMLPPEQTLVRLVGLKSETMYVVRVYTLYKKTISQYAFVYQKTNALPRKTEQHKSKRVDDVVLVLDDNESMQKSLPPSLSKAPVLTSPSMVVRPSMPSISRAVTQVTKSKSLKSVENMQITNTRNVNKELNVSIRQNEQLMLCSSNQTLSEDGQPVLVVQPEAPEDDFQTNSISVEDIAYSTTNEHPDVKTTADETEKSQMLNELLASLNKKKIGGQKSKIGKSKTMQVSTAMSSSALLVPVDSSSKNASVGQIFKLTPVKAADVKKTSCDQENATGDVVNNKLSSTASTEEKKDKTDGDVLHAVKTTGVNTEVGSENLEKEEVNTATEDIAGTNDIDITGKNIVENDDEINNLESINKPDTLKNVRDTSKDDKKRVASEKQKTAGDIVPVIAADSLIVNSQTTKSDNDNMHKSDSVSSPNVLDQSKNLTLMDGDENCLISKHLTVSLEKTNSAVCPNDNEETIQTVTTQIEEKSVELDGTGNENSSESSLKDHESEATIMKSGAMTSSTLEMEGMSPSSFDKNKSAPESEGITECFVSDEAQLEEQPALTDECEMEVNIVNVVSLSNSQGNSLLVNDELTTQKSFAPGIEAGQSETIVSADSIELSLQRSQADLELNHLDMSATEVVKELETMDHELLTTSPDNDETSLIDSEICADPVLSKKSAITSMANENTIVVAAEENALSVKKHIMELPQSLTPSSAEVVETIIDKLPNYDVNVHSSDKLETMLQQSENVAPDVILINDNCEIENKNPVLSLDMKDDDNSIILVEDENTDMTVADVIDTSDNQVEKTTVNKEPTNTLLPSVDNVYVNGPTLDDIKDIMGEDLPWL